VEKSTWTPCGGSKQLYLLIFGISLSTLNDTETDSKTGISVVCNEENYEDQNSFVKEQVIPMVTIILPVEEWSPR